MAQTDCVVSRPRLAQDLEPLVRAYTACILANIAFLEPGQQRVLEAGGVQPLVAMLKSKEDKKVTLHSTAAVQNLTYKNTSCCQEVLEEGGEKALKKLLQVCHGPHPTLPEVAATQASFAAPCQLTHPLVWAHTLCRPPRAHAMENPCGTVSRAPSRTCVAPPTTTRDVLPPPPAPCDGTSSAASDPLPRPHPPLLSISQRTCSSLPQARLPTCSSIAGRRVTRGKTDCSRLGAVRARA